MSRTSPLTWGLLRLIWGDVGAACSFCSWWLQRKGPTSRGKCNSLVNTWLLPFKNDCDVCLSSYVFVTYTCFCLLITLTVIKSKLIDCFPAVIYLYTWKPATQPILKPFFFQQTFDLKVGKTQTLPITLTISLLCSMSL